MPKLKCPSQQFFLKVQPTSTSFKAWIRNMTCLRLFTLFLPLMFFPLNLLFPHVVIRFVKFFQLDSDGDGQLSFEEFKALFDNAKKRRDISEPEAALHKTRSKVLYNDDIKVNLRRHFFFFRNHLTLSFFLQLARFQAPEEKVAPSLIRQKLPRSLAV